MHAQLRTSSLAPTLLYVALATVALPFIVFGVGFHVSGFDCADASWADSVTLPERDAIYRDLGGNVRLALVAVAALALLPLGVTLSRSGGRGASPWIAAAATVGLWVLYGVTFAVTLWLFTCQGQSL